MEKPPSTIFYEELVRQDYRERFRLDKRKIEPTPNPRMPFAYSVRACRYQVKKNREHRTLMKKSNRKLGTFMKELDAAEEAARNNPDLTRYAKYPRVA